MITENDIRLALEKALSSVDLNNEVDYIQIHVNPEDRLACLAFGDRKGRIKNQSNCYIFMGYPFIANEHVPVGKVHVGVFFRRP